MTDPQIMRFPQVLGRDEKFSFTFDLRWEFDAPEANRYAYVMHAFEPNAEGVRLPQDGWVVAAAVYMGTGGGRCLALIHENTLRGLPEPVLRDPLPPVGVSLPDAVRDGKLRITNANWVEIRGMSRWKIDWAKEANGASS